MYPKKELAQLVIAACDYYEISTVVISPGSRNAPLTIGFSNHSKIKAYSIVDERSAAFFAMGIAQQTKKPVALVCTSGSALLNYHPAIAEAFYSKIPLVIISADRPKHLIDIGDGQTIRQEYVFNNHILFSANLKEGDEKKNENIQLASEAIKKAIEGRGPVHINVPFDEPLYETVDTISDFDFPELTAHQELLNLQYDGAVNVWNASKKIMILIGENFPSEEINNSLKDYLNDEKVIVLTETISNIYHPNIINAIDKVITPFTETNFESLKPDLLITLGGMVVSKRIKQFLRKYSPEHHWHIGEHKAMNTYFCLTGHITLEPEKFLTELYQKVNKEKNKSSYQKDWLKIKSVRNTKHSEFLAKVEYSDLKASEAILSSIPNNCQLQVSNSSVIRYTQLFDLNPTLKVFCNRGTSGIDGSTSTAIGASIEVKEQTVFVTGDISFYYDSNALWNSYIPKSFRIIILNNSGGGIFKIIPGPKSTNALDYFETPHNLTAEHLAKTYGFGYSSAKNMEELKHGLTDFYKESDQPKILEVFTPSDINDVILKEYFKNL
ncbi:2-succinyl-5-enolpyruvyl-6-hydroxy-3-cyclohexene-1-carboxylate synthase [Tenacibaculum sp. MAR_2009_124]|uniref:2-succinyl-5-enolpyruvyl-6-hydroxy-3- cyclohexene-1-carboxylic-acid synthase n=1 Tax=Tenacibaculum sp. MAR_2009_124 TaxID=1250059 RepID=UPI00089C5C5E|nr:2-succinyl-5-enolpyruvyl-6-hydroxy-3-cyclohexene-1-carboxylic-acid synthase [Tenacibaculum sp. MAR_2009_124]SEB82009.1 2-succinyl-5-enolpyruvyl-6-hydroxy-3-cyclohexene-1-carboxylate synthase [Tenacibaculum sp. MAR_2009_124]